MDKITEGASFAFMVMNELIRTRKQLLNEENPKLRKALNKHFQNINTIHEKQKVNYEDNEKDKSWSS